MRFLLFLIPFFSFSVCENEFDRLQIEVRDRVSKENAEKRKEKLLELLNTHQDYLPTLIASNSELREEYLSLLKHDHSLDPNIQVIISRNLRLSRRIKSNKNDT